MSVGPGCNGVGGRVGKKKQSPNASCSSVLKVIPYECPMVDLPL